MERIEGKLGIADLPAWFFRSEIGTVVALVLDLYQQFNVRPMLASGGT